MKTFRTKSSDRRLFADCSNEQLANLHDDAIECDDFEYADRVRAILDQRGYKPQQPAPAANATDDSDIPFEERKGAWAMSNFESQLFSALERHDTKARIMTNRHAIDMLRHIEGLICSRYGVDTEIVESEHMLLIADGVETEIAVVCDSGLLCDEFDGTAFGYTAKRAFEKMLDSGYFELCSVRGTSEVAQAAIKAMKEISKRRASTDKNRV